MFIEYTTPYLLFLYIRNRKEKTIDLNEMFLITMVGVFIHCLYVILMKEIKL